MTDPLPAPVSPPTSTWVCATRSVKALPSSARATGTAARSTDSTGGNAGTGAVRGSVVTNHSTSWCTFPGTERTRHSKAPNVCARRGADEDQSSRVCPGSIRTWTRSTAPVERTCPSLGRYSIPSTRTARPVVTMPGCQRYR